MIPLNEWERAIPVLAEKGCPYCQTPDDQECKPECATGPGIYVRSSDNDWHKKQ